MPARATIVSLVAVLGSVATGCVGEPLSCSDVGGTDGLQVSLAPQVAERGGTLRVELCDDEGCRTADVDLRRPDEDGYQGTIVEWSTFGERPDDGEVELRAEVLDADGAPTASAVRTAELDYVYPNGRACDGDQYLYGSLRLRTGDRLPGGA